VLVVMVLPQRDYGARAHSTMACQVTHVASCARSFFDRSRLTGRGQSVIADGRGYSSLTQKNDGCDENDKRTTRTFSGQLPVPTSLGSQQLLRLQKPDCRY
jgi:hypothetical protein